MKRAKQTKNIMRVIKMMRVVVGLSSSLLLGGVLLSVPQAARAQVSLKAHGGGAMALRAKKVEAQIDIKGAFAQTRVLTTFQNELSAQTEADFSYTVPDGAVVTGFAYWYKGEKIVARVVEKERAARIYETIKYQRHDPALIEQTGRNTFRARIYPIEANADLKVEMQWAQVLPSDEKGLLYTLPLKPAEPGKGTLESLEIKAHIENDAGVSRIVNNYKLPIEDGNGSKKLTLSQRNYRAPQDLKIRLERPRRALQAALYAARSGGRDGFFALALSPSQAISHPRIQIHGVTTFGVLPVRLPAVGKDKTLVIVGRYRGSGRAQIFLNGFAAGAARQNVVFSDAREDNNLATKLWAARQIAALCPHMKVAPKNRERVIELSTRFTLPSVLTSWLAVPAAEWKEYEMRIAEDDVAQYGPQLAQLIRDGRENSAQARRLRAAFNAACRIMEQNPNDALREYLSEGQNAAYERRHQRAQNLAAQIVAGHDTKMRRRELQRLARASGESAQQYLQAARNNLRSARLGEVTRDWGEEIIAGRDADMRAKRLQKRYETLMQQRPRLREWEDGDIVRRPQEAYHARAHYLAAMIQSEKKSATPDAAKIAELQSELERAAKAVGSEPQHFLDQEKDAKPMSTQAMREYFMRQGDPLISVDAPKDARQVLAILPDGTIRKLVFNMDSQNWETRFDIPTYAAQGEYSIAILIVLANGSRQNLQMKFHVDTTAPQGEAHAQLSADEDNRVLRLEFDGDEDTARVFAIAPWNEKIELAPSSQKAHRFFALAPVPSEYSGDTSRVQFVLTDRAHNRTTLTLDTSR